MIDEEIRRDSNAHYNDGKQTENKPIINFRKKIFSQNNLNIYDF